jgi:5'-nucleotidase / UDP-sugar diphosphatase
MKNTVYLFLCTWLGAIAFPQVLFCQSEPTGCHRPLTILHTNDLRGHLEPTAYYDENNRGGMARIVHLLRQHPQDDLLILDGGDAFGPNILSQFDQGRLMVDLMNTAGYDGMVPGNHDLAYGLDTLHSRVLQAKFPLLAANLVRQDNGEPVLRPYALITKADLKILLIGLVSTQIQNFINPLKVAETMIKAPEIALQKTLEETQDLAVDLKIVLVHMGSAEAEALARAFPEIDLFIAGGIASTPHKDGGLHLVQTVSGNRIVSTPGGGAYIGRIRLCPDSKTTIEPSFIDADLIPISTKLEVDADVKLRLAQHRHRYKKTRAQALGTTPGRIDTPKTFVARLMRYTLATEVAVINSGALRQTALPAKDFPIATREDSAIINTAAPDTIRLADLDNLVRFDDELVRLKLTGHELKRMATSSKTRNKAGQHLVFAGYNSDTGQVNGRPLEGDESYSVTTTGYLANGGDAYLQGKKPVDASLRLQQTLVDFFSRPHPDLKSLDRKGSIWKLRTKFNSTLAWTSRNQNADRYSGALSGRDALAWSTSVDARALRSGARGMLKADLKTNFGQIRTDGRLQEAADRIDAGLVYTLRAGKTPPFIGLNTQTVWSVPAGKKRPLTLRASAGLERNFGKHLKSRWGLGLERDFAADTDRIGLEVVPEYRQKLPGSNQFKSNTKLFFGFSAPFSTSIQSYNTLLLRLWGNLHATVDANIFFQRDNDIGASGLKSELQVGIGYVWDRKVAR